MKEHFLEYDSDIRIDKYFAQVLDRANIAYRHERDDKRTKISFVSTDEIRDGLVCGVITNFYKLKILLTALPERNSLAYYSLLGATMGLEREEEILKIMEKASDAVYIDGFCNFCLREIADSWKSLGEITAKLLDRCQSEEDIYALTVFMLGVDEEPASSIVIGDVLKWEEGAEILLVPYFDDVVKDTIVTLVSSRPSDVVVPDKERIPREVMTVINSLGEREK